MDKLISVFDLGFLLLASISVGLIQMSPMSYKMLSIDLPQAEGGNELKREATHLIIDNNQQRWIKVGETRMTIEEFENFLTSKKISEALLAVDSKVNFKRVAKILGLLSAKRVKQIGFEIKGEQK